MRSDELLRCATGMSVFMLRKVGQSFADVSVVLWKNVRSASIEAAEGRTQRWACGLVATRSRRKPDRVACTRVDARRGSAVWKKRASVCAA